MLLTCKHFQDSVRHIRKVFTCGVREYGLSSNVGGWMKQWRFRQRHWASSKELRRPDFDFQSFVTALDACRANKQVPGWKSNHFLLNTAFFCNTNRLWDAASMELQAVLPSLSRIQRVLLVVLFRLLGSPKNSEGSRRGTVKLAKLTR